MSTLHPVQPLAVLAALAARFLDLHLLPRAQAPQASGEDEDIAAFLVERLHLAPVTARDAAREARSQAPHWTDALEILAQDLVVMEGGRPTRRAGEAWTRLSWMVFGDAVVAWRLRRSPPLILADRLRAASSWPPVLDLSRGPFAGLLARPMAETHMHLGGAVPPGLLWMFLASGVVPFHHLVPVEGMAHEARDGWVPAVEAAASSLAQWMGVKGEDAMRGSAVARMRGLREAIAWRIALTREIPGPRWDQWPLCAVEDEDPLAALAVERDVLMQEFGRGSRDERLFTYLRTRTTFQALLVHPEGPRGFLPFQETFNRRSFYFQPAAGRGRNRRTIAAGLEQQRLVQVIETVVRDAMGPGGERARRRSMATPDGAGDEQSHHVSPLDLEIRVSLPLGQACRDTLRAWAAGVHRALLRWPDVPLRVGFVVHFLKSPLEAVHGSAAWQAHGLATLLEREPMWRPLIVGVDVAGPELFPLQPVPRGGRGGHKTETWPAAFAPPRDYAPLYHWIRAKLDEPSAGWEGGPVSVGFTYHVGEDFRDLLTGIRHVDEAAHLLSLRAGDRLGHALAIGWPPDLWYHSPRVSRPLLGQHLVDLLWAWELLRKEARDQGEAIRTAYDLIVHRVDPSALPHLEALARLLSPGSPWSREGLRAMARTLEPNLPLTGQNLHRLVEGGATYRSFPSLEERVLPERFLITALTCSDEMADRQDDPPVDLERWIRLVEVVQRVARRRLQARNLVIEVNPTSNRTIGELSSQVHVPYLRMNSAHLPRSLDEGTPIPLSINTDNPGVFKTSLRSEYDRVGRALLEQEGFPVRAVTAWLDEARQVGLDSTFIPRDAPRGRALARYLEDLLPELRS